MLQREVQNHRSAESSHRLFSLSGFDFWWLGKADRLKPVLLTFALRVAGLRWAGSSRAGPAAERLRQAQGL